MPNINELEEAPRKEMHVFYVLDTSGSMSGTKISMLNRCMEESIDALTEEDYCCDIQLHDLSTLQ